MKKLIQKWLGIIDGNTAYLELEGALERIRDLESLCDDLKYEQENLEYNLSELEIRVDEIEEIDIQNFKDNLKDKVNALKDEVNDVLSDFEIMTEGYTVSVKLNPPLS